MFNNLERTAFQYVLRCLKLAGLCKAVYNYHLVLWWCALKPAYDIFIDALQKHLEDAEAIELAFTLFEAATERDCIKDTPAGIAGCIIVLIDTVFTNRKPFPSDIPLLQQGCTL